MIRNLHRFIKKLSLLSLLYPPPLVKGTTCLYTYVATQLSLALTSKKVEDMWHCPRGTVASENYL